jgi:ribosomal protein L37E
MIASIFSDWAVIFAAIAVLVAATGVMAWISNRVRKQEETNDSAVDMFLREDPEVVRPYNSVAEALTAALKHEAEKYPKGSKQNPDYSTHPFCPRCGSHALDRQPNSYLLRYCKSCGYYFNFTGATSPSPKIISKAQLKKEIEESSSD